MPALGLSYLVYTANPHGNGDVIWYRPILAPDDIAQGTRPNIGDEHKIELGTGFDIKAFYALALETDNQVMIVFEDQRQKMWRLVHDFSSNTVIESYAELFDGRLPALDFDGILRLLYVLGEDVVMRNDFAEVLTLVTPSERDIRDFDTKFKAGVSVLRYAGSHFLTNDIAIRFSTIDANHVVVYDGDIGLTDVTTEVDEIISGNNATLLNGAQILPAGSLPGGGIVGDAVFVDYTVNQFSQLAADGLALAGAPGITILIWAYGGPNLPQTSYVAHSTIDTYVTNIHFPWSNSNIYWDCGDGSSYDRVNYAESAGNFQGSWAHWAFTKDVASGIMRVYRNASQRTSGSSKTIPMTDTPFFNPIHSNWDGWMAEMAVIPRELSVGEISAARTRGIAGQRIDAALVPGLQYYWVMDENPGQGFLDKSGNNAHAGVPTRGWLTKPQGFEAYDDASFNIGSFTWTSEITLEAWASLGLKRRFKDFFSGATTLRVWQNGVIEFRFGSTVWRGFRKIDPGRRVHLAVSHVFGDGSGTFVTVDGEAVVGDWIVGDGTESPALSGALSCNVGPGDQIFQMRISDVARPLSYIRDHVGGRA